MVLLAAWVVWEVVGIMQLRKASLAASSRNAANGGIIKPAMKHSRTFCSISPCFITTKDCIHAWITKIRTNMKLKQQNDESCLTEVSGFTWPGHYHGFRKICKTNHYVSSERLLCVEAPPVVGIATLTTVYGIGLSSLCAHQSRCVIPASPSHTLALFLPRTSRI